MKLYGAFDVKNPIDWSQQWVYQMITHEIGHALGLDHDTCASNSMMQAAPGPRQILSIQPGECLLANYINCDSDSDAKCPTQDPRKPPVNSWNYHHLDICSQLPDLCVNSQPWLVVWDCISTRVTVTDGCYSQDGKTCLLNAPGGGAVERNARVSNIANGPTTQWAKDDTVCYPTFQQGGGPKSDPFPLTSGTTGPAAAILAPADGQTVAGIIQVTGAATQGITGAGKVAFWLDGLPLQLTGFAPGVAAPEVCADPAVGDDPACPDVGFTGALDTRTIANGAHTLQAVVLDRRAQYPAATYFERSFVIENSCSDTTPPSVAITSPSAGTVSGVTTVSVAASDNVKVSQVSLYLDGAIVTAWSASPYTYTWDTRALSASSHTLQARVSDTCGNTSASTTVHVMTANPLLYMYIDIPAANASLAGGSVSLQGWATDAVGVASVAFAVDGVPLHLLAPYSYGLNRSDVCNAYPGDPNCPRVGWSASFDATQLINGSHSLAVTATDRQGQTAVATRTVNVNNPSISTLIWVQPAALAGFGPPGSLVVAGSASGGPSGLGVQLWWQDLSSGITQGTGNWILATYAAEPDSDGVWTNAIPNFDPTHEYQMYAVYNGTASRTCTYPASNGLYWCP